MATGNTIQLNVGGKIYDTTLSTLNKYPQSRFGQMFSSGTIDTDSHGRVFIDRDGALFRHILNFLRTDTLLLPDHFQEMALLMAETEYFNLPKMAEALEELKSKTTLNVEERVYEQSGRHYAGTYVDWLIQGDRSAILWLNESGTFCLTDNNSSEVTISEDGTHLHRPWYNDVRIGVTDGGYQYGFCKPSDSVPKECLFKEISSLGYKLKKKVNSVTIPEELPFVVRPFVHFMNEKSNTYIFELCK